MQHSVWPWPRFRGRRNTLDTWTRRNAKRIGSRPSALHSTFHFWRKSCRIASFLMLSTSKIEEVSQNSFVFDVVTFKSWGSLEELLRFWCCHVQKLRKSRRIASFSNLQIDRFIARYNDRQLQLQLQLRLQIQMQICYSYTTVLVHYSTLITLHYTNYCTLHYIHQLHYNTLITAHYTNYTTTITTAKTTITVTTTATTTTTTTLHYNTIH